MSSTPRSVVLIIVSTLSALATIGVIALAGTLFYKSYADPAVLTAFIAITSGSIGSLSSLLVNTRQPVNGKSTTTEISSVQPATVTVEPTKP